MISRMAPSNTGVPTIGNARTLFIAHLTALKAGGETILRIESTDAKRSTEDSTSKIYDTLRFLNISYNPTVVDQATNHTLGVYKDIADTLVANGFAYYCNCTVDRLKRLKLAQIETNQPRRFYDGFCRSARNTKGTLRLNAEYSTKYFGMIDVLFEDNTYGSRKVNFRDIQDTILLREDGSPTYMLANVVDDVLAGVTNIVRGVDLLPQTALQIVLASAIRESLHIPQRTISYTHLPLIVNNKGEKLSKRDQNTKSVLDYEREGYLTDAICQYICALGNTSVPTNIPLSREQLVDVYDNTKTSQSNVKLCEINLKAINKLHVANSSTEYLKAKLEDLYGVTFSDKLIDLYKVRSATLVELKDNIEFVIGRLKDNKENIYNMKVKLNTLKAMQEFRQVVLLGRSTAPIEDLLEALAS